MTAAKIWQSVIVVACMVGLLLTHGAAISQTGDDSHDDIYSVAWRPDGLQIATGHSLLGDFRLWDAATGDLLNTVYIPDLGFSIPPRVGDVEWDPNGSRLAVNVTNSLYFTSHLLVVDATTGEILHDLETSSIHDAAWSPDGTLLANDIIKSFSTCFERCKIHVWDVSTEQLVAELDTDDVVFKLAWSPDGSRLASIGWGQATIWDRQTWTALVKIGKGPDLWTSLWVTWSPDGTRVATPTTTGLAHIWDAVTGDLQMTLKSNDPEPLEQVEWQPGGNLLVGRNEYALIFWDTTTGQEVGRIETPDRAVHAAWSPDGTQLAYGGEMGPILNIVRVEQIVHAP